MNYYVHWLPAAHDRLEEIWMSADDPRIVLRAANIIDEKLARDPRTVEACLGDENTLIVEPLAINYDIDEVQHKVFVTAIWMIGFLDRDN